MASLQYVDVPGYAALILRQSYPDLSLPGAIMDRSHDWLRPTDATWNETAKTWTFPSGATLSFGYIQHEADKYRYQGSELQFIAFDELTAFSESQYRYLFSRLRRLESADVPLRMRAASNPGGLGHEWVKQRFLIEGPTAGRVFIPARLDDNPHLDAAAYRESLSALDPVTRAQLLSGDWDVREPGNLFQRQWFGIVDEAPVPLKRVRYWDMAATEPKPGRDPDWTAGVLLGKSERGTYYVLDVRRMRGTPQATEDLVRQTAELDGRDVPIRMEQEPGSSGVQAIDYYTRQVLAGFAFRGVRSTGPKEARAAPVSSQAEAGNIKLWRGAWIGAFLDEAAAFGLPGVHDDQIDALSGAFAELAPHGPAGNRTAVGPPRPAVAAYSPR
jgi:predicted phage terminase large subunit-like protein